MSQPADITPTPVDPAPPAPTALPIAAAEPAPGAPTLHVTQCGVCKQVDDHPKHGFVLNAATGEETRRHMDCCAVIGCPICADQISDAGGVKGHELRAHLVAKSSNP